MDLLPARWRHLRFVVVSAAFVVVVAGAQQQTSVTTSQLQQPREVSTTITGDQSGTPLRFAVPDFIALSTDAETIEVATTIGQILRDDLDFEREFTLIPRGVLATVPAARSVDAVPFDRWRELDADGVVVGTVRKIPSGVRVEVRVFSVRTRQSAFAMAYEGAATSNRLYAHRASDDIHRQQRGLQGVAQTKLTFNSDRSGDRVGGPVPNRVAREILFCDYDGENVKTVTANRQLNIASVWSPDARSLAYTSWRGNDAGQIFVSHVYDGVPLQRLTDGKSQNMLPAWSPDGTQIAFTSWRDGNGAEIYVMNRDGSNVRRLTNNIYDDTTPTWSPNGARIAFTSGRTGTAQIWEMDKDGLGQRLLTNEVAADRPTWSLAPFNEIAFAAQTSPGRYDIKSLDMTTSAVRQLTSGEGNNESPAFAPNGRHIAFTSTRAGSEQIFTMSRDGKDVRQITRTGNNRMANWSQAPRN